MNIGETSVKGVPTTVSVSRAFLEKCMKDPEKAVYLVPDCNENLKNFTKKMPGNPSVTYTSYIFNDEGEITEMSGCSNAQNNNGIIDNNILLKTANKSSKNIT